jgi:hypothetical protein
MRIVFAAYVLLIVAGVGYFIAPRPVSASPRRRFLRDNSLSLVFLVLFLLALAGQAVAGHRLYNDEQRVHGEPAVSLPQFLTSSRFAVETAENWQSEFLAMGTMAIFAVYLRQRGSPESKPVGAPHVETTSAD